MKNARVIGWGLVLPVIFLAGIGLACIHATERQRSGASVSAAESGGTGLLSETYRAVGALTARQAVYLVAGVVVMALLLRPSYEKLGRFAYPFYGVVLALLGLLVVGHVLDRLGLPGLPFVPKLRNTHRWIGVDPLRVQPSEFMKLALVVVLARYLRYRSSYRRWWGLVPPLLLTLLPMVLILFQPDLGTLLMLLPVLFAMLFTAGARLRHLALVIGLGCATLPLFYFYGMKEYQRDRVRVLFRQNTSDEAWHMDQGFQLRQAKLALATGKITGTGYGAGLFVQYDLLPEEHNDFIFALIGHQWGFVGALLVILAYGTIVVCGLEVVMLTNDPFGRLLAIGVIVMIVAQALLNIGMTVGLAPITGMPLPFVSAGGSSMLANFMALGLLLNVARRRPLRLEQPPFAHE